MTRAPGEVHYYFQGSLHPEEEVVEQFRVLAPRLREDLKTTSGAPTFFEHTPGDVALDNFDLAGYLEARAADLPLLRWAIDEAYLAEYGRETHEQSCLNLLFFIHADRRSKWQPFGVFSDERYHLVDGNDAIATGIAARLPGPIELGMRLTELRRLPNGEYELCFAGGALRRADVVVLAIPFTILRQVTLDASLGFSDDKLRAIRDLGYGYNAKTMVGFQGRPWLALHGSSGAGYADLEQFQTAWETNPIRAGATSVLTDYAGGERGRTLDQQSLSGQVAAFLNDLELVWPGASASASPGPGGVLAFREHWPSNPLSLGSYTCYLPGQFTRIAGLEAQPAGQVYFAGEHADSFYSWQGFMEGACLSGHAAARQIVKDFRL